jgi:hypothetical protein
MELLSRSAGNEARHLTLGGQHLRSALDNVHFCTRSNDVTVRSKSSISCLGGIGGVSITDTGEIETTGKRSGCRAVSIACNVKLQSLYGEPRALFQMLYILMYRLETRN